MQLQFIDLILNSVFNLIGFGDFLRISFVLAIYIPVVILIFGT